MYRNITDHPLPSPQRKGKAMIALPYRVDSKLQQARSLRLHNIRSVDKRKTGWRG